MKHVSRVLIGSGLCLAACGLLLVSSTHAQNDDLSSLEATLSSLRDQWDKSQRDFAREAARIHASANQVRSQLCQEGKYEYCPTVDMDKLAHAVAVAETQNCTTGVGATMNNCHGIRVCTADKGCGFQSFKTPEDSYRAFKYIWRNGYGEHFPTLADAQRYAASDAHEWYQIVTEVYDRSMN